MNTLRYGTIAVGAPYSQKRFEALVEDLIKAYCDLSIGEDEILEYQKEIALDYPDFKAITENFDVMVNGNIILFKCIPTRD